MMKSIRNKLKSRFNRMSLSGFLKVSLSGFSKVSLSGLTRQSLLLVPLLFTACNFETLFSPSFDEPVKGFFETYTNTAAIEEHILSVETYSDDSSRLCINSDEECSVEFYLRNPQLYTLTPSVNFSSLTGIDTSEVKIEQTDKSTIKLILPQSFLADSDEGKNISPTISLVEPMSGRSFSDYSFSLYSNTKPPLLNNATILNDNNTTFVIAFDMPSQAELALRQKDLNSITINGKSYPVEISEDGNFTFTDSAFSTTEKTYSAISSKTFTYSDRSVYFTTGDPFSDGDKEYTIILSDTAGLTTETLASTKITKLNTPTVKNPAGNQIESSYDSVTKEYTPKTLPKLSGKDYSTVTITAPEEDNTGNKVAEEGLEVHYTLYYGTPKSAKLSKSGTFNAKDGSKTVDLSVGSWYLETYATKTNYEKSAVTKSYIRVVDSYIYIGENGSDNDDEADGTDATPYGTISKAIADINSRNDNTVEYTLVIGGNVAGESNTKTISAAGLVIMAASSASTDKINTLSLSTDIPVKFTDITVGELTVSSANNFTVSDNAVIEKTTVGTGASLKIESSAVITEAVLEGSGLITIAGNLGNAVAATVTPASYTNGTQVLTNNEYLAANYTKFALKQNNEDTVWTITSEGKLKETAKRNISINVIQQESDITVNQQDNGNNVLFTVTNGTYDSYSWTTIGYSTPELMGSEDSFIVPTNGLLTGVYDVYLEAEKDGLKYSYHAQIKVD